MSSVEVIAFFTSVNAILNLWAPGAFTLDDPVALSNKLVSSSGVVKDSATLNPIR